MSVTPAKLLKEARRKAGYHKAREAYDAHEHSWPFKYSTYVSYENGQRPITADAARVLSATYKRAGLKFSDLYPIDEDIQTAPDVPVVGVIRMDTWFDIRLEDKKTPKRLKGIPKTGSEARHALHILDNSVNRYVEPGDFAIYTPISGDAGEPAQYDGELLYIEVVQGHLAQRSIRMAKMLKTGRLELLPYSTEAKYATACFYPCTDGAVSVLGVVIGKFSQRRSRFSTDK